MKIQHAGKIQTKQPSGNKKSRADGVFQSLLDAEVTDKQAANFSDEKQNHPDLQQQNIILLEEAAEVLDRTLLQLEAGHIPDSATIDTIQQLRKQLQTRNTSNSHELHHADTLLAIEAARIKSLQV